MPDGTPPLPAPEAPGLADRLRGTLHRLAASRGFQRWAARVPGLRGRTAAEGAALFDVMAGFVNAQVLSALVEIEVFDHLQAGPQPVARLAALTGVPESRMAVLAQAGAALGLLRRGRDGRFGLSLRGAAFRGVPGLAAMVRHHAVLYRDLADPAAFFRGATDPELARFWPYVFGAAGASDPALAARYSRLMTESQVLVAEDTLRLADLRGVTRLLDVGGGTGAFLSHVARAHPQIARVLFDLPAVVAAAAPAPGLTVAPGSFRDDPLPTGADAISLVRVLYDHADSTVALLLAKAFAALPPGGRILVSEPMSGGARPDRATDAYFAVYTLAMRTGRTRSAAEIAAHLSTAGFTAIRHRPGPRPYVTSLVEARRPE
jgi:demethylspheroidene O-methyltransferase